MPLASPAMKDHPTPTVTASATRPRRARPGSPGPRPALPTAARPPSPPRGPLLVDVGLVLLEHQDRVAADHHQEDHRRPDQRVDQHAAVGSDHVLVEDLPQAVEAVQHRQVDHRQVPEPPDDPGLRVGPSVGDELVIHRLDVVLDVRDEQVPERQQHQEQTRDPHEEPGEELETTRRLQMPRHRRQPSPRFVSDPTGLYLAGPATKETRPG